MPQTAQRTWEETVSVAFPLARRIGVKIISWAKNRSIRILVVFIALLFIIFIMLAPTPESIDREVRQALPH